MSKNTLPTLQVDGISFLGGGVRCSVSQYAFMCTVMHKLKLIPEELFYKIKYISGNSGAAFTIATLLCYPLMTDIWPLQKVKTLSQSDLENFYKTYWTDALKAKFNISKSIFTGVEVSNVGMNSWMNALTTLAIAPFANKIGGIKFKDVPMANSQNMVVSFGATTLQNSSMRAKSGDLVDIDVYVNSTDYTWTKTWPSGISGLKGFPINLIYGYGNTIQTDTTFFNGDTGSITYTSKSEPTSQCNIAAILKLLDPKSSDYHQNNFNYTDTPSTPSSPVTKTVTVPNTHLKGSQLGESIFMAVVAASSSFIGCNPQNMPSSIGDCGNNFANYDQAVMFDFKQGLLLANSANKVTKYPQKPWKDNGTLDLTDPKATPQYLNLCDGTDSYDNTGIIPMIRAWQMYEDLKTLTSKTYTIFYVDGVDPGDQQTHSDTPSFGHFVKLFTKLNGMDSPQGAFGLEIFDADPTAPTFQYDYTGPKDKLGGDISLKLFYYQGLKTLKNDYVGVQAGIKLNLIAMTPMVQLNTTYESWDDIDNHAFVNQQLILLMQQMDKDHDWISKLFRAPPPTYKCVNHQCTEGKGTQTLADCQKGCFDPTSEIFHCNQKTYKCELGFDDQGNGSSLTDCQNSCSSTPPPPSSGSKLRGWKLALVIIATIIMMTLIFIWIGMKRHHHNMELRSNPTTLKRKRGK